MKLRSQCAICVVAGIGLFAACGDDDSGTDNPGTGGVGGAGGATTGGVGGKASGGSTSSGGQVGSSGGAGGGPGSGGASSGGASSGGAASGGASSGGAASGGASSGGASSGGASSGGASSGGASSGGASSGGASSGGAASGGAAPDGGESDGGDEPDGSTVGTIVINEVESDNGVPDDWAELYNTGTTPIDISGWLFRDNGTAAYTIPANTIVAGGAYYVIERGVMASGLGSSDQARLFNGTTVVDSVTWTEHASGTLRRCPDGTGAIVAGTGAGTKGAANVCP